MCVQCIIPPYTKSNNFLVSFAKCRFLINYTDTYIYNINIYILLEEIVKKENLSEN